MPTPAGRPSVTIAVARSSDGRMKIAIGQIVALLLVVGCGAPSPSASEAAAASGGIDPGACALATQPGPNDRPPKGGGELMDLTDAGAGRWRVCTIEPGALIVEGTAWCRWNEGRTAVEEVQGLPVLAGGGTLDGGVVMGRAAIYLSTTLPDGTIHSYDSTNIPQVVDAVDGGRSGAARFLLDPILDPEHPPAVRPPNVAGVLRWQCGEPPAPRS
jgi:hypothetical protein